MKCPRCGNPMRVSTTWDSGTVRKRRRSCLRCHAVFTTAERITEEEKPEIFDVVAVDGNEVEIRLE